MHVPAWAITVSKCMTSLSVLVPYLGLRVQGSGGSRGSMNDCLLSGGKQKNVCVCLDLRERNRKQRLTEWQKERDGAGRDRDRWKYKHKQETEIYRLASRRETNFFPHFSNSLHPVIVHISFSHSSEAFRVAVFVWIGSHQCKKMV